MGRIVEARDTKFICNYIKDEIDQSERLRLLFQLDGFDFRREFRIRNDIKLDRCDRTIYTIGENNNIVTIGISQDIISLEVWLSRFMRYPQLYCYEYYREDLPKLYKPEEMGATILNGGQFILGFPKK